MATLNSFGFSVRKANAPDGNNASAKKAVVQPSKPRSVTVAARPSRASKTQHQRKGASSTGQQTTLTRFLTPQAPPTIPITAENTTTNGTDSNGIDDQDSSPCVIRRRIPFMDVWASMVAEFDDPLSSCELADDSKETSDTADDDHDDCLIGRGRRRVHDEDDHDMKEARTKRQNAPNLTLAFQQFMSIQLPLTHLKPVPYTSILEDYEPEEDLRRVVRRRMTVDEANALLTHIVDEFLPYPSVN